MTVAAVLRAVGDDLGWPGIVATQAAAYAPLSDLLTGLRADALQRLEETTVGELARDAGTEPLS